MNWDYSFFDAVQLMIPILCFVLTTVVVLVYLFLYLNSRIRLYFAGFLLSLGAALYILFESLVTITGWTGVIETGRIFHFIQELTAVYFLYSIMLFASLLTDSEGLMSRISVRLSHIGLAAAALITIAALINPDLFVSLTQSSDYIYESPSAFARGQEGFLYTLRDILLGIYLFFLIFISSVSLFRKQDNIKTGLIVLGTLCAAVSAIDDLSHFYFKRNFFFNDFRYSRLAVGLSLMNFLIMIAILNDYFRTEHRLRTVYSDLKNTHNRLQDSEKKYRRLAEGADQAIFSLSSDFKFLSHNRKARQYFHLSGDRVGKALPVLLSTTALSDNSGVSRHIILEHLRQLSRDKASVSFHSVINDLKTGEPEELEFHIDYYENDEGVVEYICRAEKMKTNRLIRSIEEESLNLSIENYILAIDEVTTRLTGSLSKYLDRSSSLMIKMGLQEIILNAIEHGNLNISFEEKSKALKENRYLDFVRNRQSDPGYKDRKVRIDYFLNKDEVQYRITDEGDGFDYESTMNMVDSSVGIKSLPHGRGINMTRVLFDEMKYNSKGNQVVLIKKFSN